MGFMRFGISGERRMKLIIIIPAYNEEASIGSVIKRIPDLTFKKSESKNLLEKASPKTNISETEVIVIDDGSNDNTGKIAKENGAIVVSHVGNKGVGKAFRTGIEVALKRKADIIVNIDADGQFNPEDIPKLITPILNKESDFVTATRFKNGNLIGKMPFIKKLGNKAFTKLTSLLTGQRFTDTQCGFRAYSREAALRLNLYGKFTYTQEVFLDLANKEMKIMEIPLYVKAKRDHGESKVVKSVPKYVFQAMTIIIRSIRDYKPLAFFGTIGMFSLILGLISGGFMIVRYILTGRTSPFQSLLIVAVGLTVLGVLLIILALIADMLDRQRRIQEDLLYLRKKEEYSK